MIFENYITLWKQKYNLSMRTKRNITSILLVAFVALVLAGCKDNSTTLPEEILVHPDSIEEKFPFADMFHYEKCIPLETNEKCQISELHRVFPLDSVLVIWDRSGEKVFVFNRNGKFLNKIGDKGHGNVEYVRLRDVLVDYKKKTINLLDDFSHKILSFHQDGTHVETIKYNKTGAFGFYCDDEKVWLESDGLNDSTSLLSVYDREKGETEKTYFPMFKDGRIPILSEKTFSVDPEGQVLFSTPYINTIYKIENDRLFPKYRVNIIGNTLDDSDLTSDSYIEGLQAKNYYGNISDVYHVNDYLFFLFRFLYKGSSKLTSYSVCYNTKEKVCHLFDYTLQHDKKLTFSPGCFIIGSGQNELFFTLDLSSYPTELLPIIHRMPELSNCTNDDNPIIVVYNVP